jgi:hypothetical protein
MSLFLAHTKKIEKTKVKYKVFIPDAAEQGEKSLEAPKMLAQQIEANITKITAY